MLYGWMWLMGKASSLASLLLQGIFSCVFFSLGVTLFGLGTFNQTILTSLIAFTGATITMYLIGVRNRFAKTVLTGLLTCGLFSLLLWFVVKASFTHTLFLSVTAWVCGVVSSNIVKLLLTRKSQVGGR